MTAAWTPDGTENRLYRLDIRTTGSDYALGWDRAPNYPLVESQTFEVGHDVDGVDHADDVMARRPSTEHGFLYWVNHPHGERYDVTIEGGAV
jgi:hypothetical protein